MIFIQRDGSESRKLSYDNNVCLACGICADSCPTTSLALGDVLGIARGQAEGNYLVLDDNTCVLCGLCASACPFGALSFEIDGVDAKELSNYPTWTHESAIDEDACEFCGRCTVACPQDAILFKRELPDRNDLLVGEISISDEDCIYCSVCGMKINVYTVEYVKEHVLKMQLKLYAVPVCTVMNLKNLKLPVTYLLDLIVLTVDGVRKSVLLMQLKLLNHLKETLPLPMKNVSAVDLVWTFVHVMQ